MPYVKPTTEWSVLSVPVSDAILLPETGNFYYVPSYNSSTQSVDKAQLENTKGIKGGQGMLLKGTVGTVYRFREAPSGTSTPAYMTVPDNHLLGVPADNNSASYSGNNTSGPWYYTFDGTKFNKSSGVLIYSGDACLRLQSSDGATSSTSTVYLNSSDLTLYDLWINGTQVSSANASNLSVIDGYWLTEKCKILLTCCILNMIGLSNIEINQCCENSPITEMIKSNPFEFE